MTEITAKIHEAYQMCQKTFSPSIELLDESTNITDDEELHFYRIVSDFFMQQKQKEIIREG